uniref:EF-hand domain-containing protein n=1 Tax=Panagrellus redivivus TaxID=6233 RepID=A0A7E4V6I8_PANRE
MVDKLEQKSTRYSMRQHDQLDTAEKDRLNNVPTRYSIGFGDLVGEQHDQKPDIDAKDTKLKGVAKNKLPTYLRKNGRKYRINYIELKRFIVYSVVAGGYICSCCMLVYPHKQALFVSEPNKCFQQISQKDEAHCVTEAHCQAVKQCTRLMNNTPTVSDVIQFQAVEDDKTRRASLVPVIQSLLWLSKRGYGIRGTVESGPVSLPSCFEEIDFDGGGLRSLIQLFAVRGDTESEKHIKYGTKTAPTSLPSSKMSC